MKTLALIYTYASYKLIEIDHETPQCVYAKEWHPYLARFGAVTRFYKDKVVVRNVTVEEYEEVAAMVKRQNEEERALDQKHRRERDAAIATIKAKAL